MCWSCGSRNVKQNEGQETARYGRGKLMMMVRLNTREILYYDDRGSSLLITHLPGGALWATRKPTSFLSNSAFLSTSGGGSTTSAALEEEAAPDGAARGGSKTSPSPRPPRRPSPQQRRPSQSSSFSSFAASSWSSSLKRRVMSSANCDRLCTSLWICTKHACNKKHLEQHDYT